jgi:hypothetical protein
LENCSLILPAQLENLAGLGIPDGVLARAGETALCKGSGREQGSQRSKSE